MALFNPFLLPPSSDKYDHLYRPSDTQLRYCQGGVSPGITGGVAGSAERDVFVSIPRPLLPGGGGRPDEGGGQYCPTAQVRATTGGGCGDPVFSLLLRTSRNLVV